MGFSLYKRKYVKGILEVIKQFLAIFVSYYEFALMVKKLLSFVFLISFISASTAFADGTKEDKKTGTEDTQSDKNEKEEKLEETEYTTVKNKSQTDSSFHSISKYNFLFYMVYKVKYGDMDPVSENKTAIAEE